LSSLRNVLLNGILLTLSLAIGLKLVDLVLIWKSSKLPGLDLDVTVNTIRTLDLYPYDGWHVQSNFNHTEGSIFGGPGRGEDSYARLEIQTGPLGHFISPRTDTFPPKQRGEFRIILIGGSGAQGWGATSNRAMLYSRLEEVLNERTQGNPHVSVMNMAMGSSLTYQNYISLNRWGHALLPDMILTYSGRNDFAVPLYHEPITDGFIYFTELNALALAARGSEFPPQIGWLLKFLPNLMTKTNLGYAIKTTFFYNYYVERAAKLYRQNVGITATDRRRALETVVIPLYVHALKSIKRDFSGIPIMVAWQAIGQDEIAFHEQELGEDFYDRFFTAAMHATNGYMNTGWYYLNVHAALAENPQPYIQTHLGDKGHEIVAMMIAEALLPVIKRQASAGSGTAK
jgi:hypothetical protein